jgi:hypothetical protein
MSNHKKWLSGTCVALCLAGGGALAVTGAGADDSSPAPQPEVAAADSAPVQSVPPEESEDIGQLRRDRTTDDALPSAARDELANEGADDHWGANPYLSRRTAPGVWIVPGDGYVCVANTPPSGGGVGFGCATTEDVGRGLLAPSDVDADGNGVLTGVLPDGVDHVTLVDRDGSTRDVDVDRNTYRAEIDANLKEVRFTGPDGVDHALPMGWDR